MSKLKKLAAGVSVVAVIALVGVSYWAYDTFNTKRSQVADDTVALADFTATDTAAITRGEYVMRTGDCIACHTADGAEFAGSHKFETPFGTLLSSNITPDRETGIGNMTERDFFDAVRHGQGSKGFLYPAMPYTAYANLTDQDMHDLWSYMSTVEPVDNKVDENAGMPFPFNIRLAMAGWNLLFFSNEPFQEQLVQLNEQELRGKYLVDGGAHCSVCHTPRNVLGAERSSAYLHGGNLGEYFAPDITSNEGVGIGSLPIEEIVAYLKTGANKTAIAAGPMAEAVEHSLQYLTDEDLTSIAAYLKTVPASPAVPSKGFAMDEAARQRAALAYEVNCSACHGLEGEGIDGMVPPFKDNRGIMASDATNLINAMLNGARAPHTATLQTAAGMPSFEWKMNDAQIAEILDFVRNSWGNAGDQVQPASVAAMRDRLGSRQKIETPH